MLLGISKKEPSLREGINSFPKPGNAWLKPDQRPFVRMLIPALSMVLGMIPNTRAKPNQTIKPNRIMKEGKMKKMVKKQFLTNLKLYQKIF
jgi:hypothetical protein